jgi:hypothetical protein
MKTITVRGVDPDLDQAIKSRAEGDNISVNQWVLKILKKATGMEKSLCSGSTTILMNWPVVGPRKTQWPFRKTLRSLRGSTRMSGSETNRH